MGDERNLENREMYEKEELGTVILALEDGRKIEYGILEVFEVEGCDSNYITLVSEGDNEIMVYKYKETNEEETDLGAIESDAEYGKTEGAFESLFIGSDGKDEK